MQTRMNGRMDGPINKKETVVEFLMLFWVAKIDT